MTKGKASVCWRLLLVVAFIVSTAMVCQAADEDFARFGARIRALYIMPDEKIDIAGLTVDDGLAPEIDFEYFVTRNFSAELVLALSKHDIMLDNGGVNAGSLWLLPPSLLVKYHPLPNFKVSPYVGFGMNVVMPFDETLTVNGGRVPFKVDTTVGWAAQIGADIPLTKNCFFNVDVKYYDTGMDATIAGTKHKLELDPIIIGTGIGIRF